MKTGSKPGFLLAVAAFACAPTLALAQGDTGFLRGAGNWDAALSWSLDTYDEFWVGEDKISAPPVGEVDRTAVNFYGAYGIHDDLDVHLSAAWVEAEASGTANFDVNRDLQDFVVGARYRACRGRAGPGDWHVLVAPALKAPITNYENNDVTSLGDGQTDLRARVVGQYRFDQGAFVAIESGYDFRLSDPPIEVPFHLTGGITVMERVTIMPFFSLVNASDGTNIGGGPFATNEEDHTRAGIGAYVRVTDGFGVSGYWRETLDGRNTGDATGYSVGIVYSMRPPTSPS